MQNSHLPAHLYAHLLDCNHDLMAILDPEGKILYANLSFINYAQTAFKTDIEFEVSSILEVIPSFLINEYENLLKDVPQRKEIIRRVFRNHSNTLLGEMYFQEQLKLIEPALDIPLIGWVLKNITNEYKAINQLSENESLVNSIFEYHTDEIWAVNTNYELIAFNKAFENGVKEAFGISIYYTANLIELYKKHNLEKYAELFSMRYDRALKGENFVEMDSYKIEGKIFYREFRFSPIREFDNIIGVSVFSKNITEQMLAQARLAESETFLSTAQNIAKVAGWRQHMHNDDFFFTSYLHEMLDWSSVVMLNFEGFKRAIGDDNWSIIQKNINNV